MPAGRGKLASLTSRLTECKSRAGTSTQVRKRARLTRGNVMTDVPKGGWLNAEKGKSHYDDGGWCRCCCDDCVPVGCSHVSNPSTCTAHPYIADERTS